MWCHAMPAPELHEPFTAVAFIGTNGFRVLAGQLREQGRMCLTTAQQPCIGISAAAVEWVRLLKRAPWKSLREDLFFLTWELA